MYCEAETSEGAFTLDTASYIQRKMDLLKGSPNHEPTMFYFIRTTS